MPDASTPRLPSRMLFTGVDAETSNDDSRDDRVGGRHAAEHQPWLVARYPIEGARRFADGMSSFLVRRLDETTSSSCSTAPPAPNATWWCWPRRSTRPSSSGIRPAWSGSSGSWASPLGRPELAPRTTGGVLGRLGHGLRRLRQQARARQAAGVRGARPGCPRHRRGADAATVPQAPGRIAMTIVTATLITVVRENMMYLNALRSSSGLLDASCRHINKVKETTPIAKDITTSALDQPLLPALLKP